MQAICSLTIENLDNEQFDPVTLNQTRIVPSASLGLRWSGNLGSVDTQDRQAHWLCRPTALVYRR
jgi:hypothetical protein